MHCLKFPYYIFKRVLVNPTASAGSEVTEGNEFWVIGGTGGGTALTQKSTQFLADSGTNFVLGAYSPELTVEFVDPCVVAFNSSHLFVSGGSKKAYLLDTADNDVATAWTELPEMSQVRSGHSCGLVTDVSSGDQYIVAAGGTNSLATDIYDIQDGSW